MSARSRLDVFVCSHLPYLPPSLTYNVSLRVFSLLPKFSIPVLPSVSSLPLSVPPQLIRELKEEVKKLHDVIKAEGLEAKVASYGERELREGGREGGRVGGREREGGREGEREKEGGREGAHSSSGRLERKAGGWKAAMVRVALTGNPPSLSTSCGLVGSCVRLRLVLYVTELEGNWAKFSTHNQNSSCL